MTDTVYIRPIGFAPGPQSEEGDAIRLAGGLVYASRFAVIYRRDGRVVERWRASPGSIAQVLGQLPDSVAAEAEAQWGNLRMAHPALELGARTVRLDQPQVMGILNVTPDSFSDGGKHVGDPAGTREAIGAMVEAGASIIDIGGESTRPGAEAVWEEEEVRRVVPAVEAAASMGAAVSIDTRRAGTMEAALKAGAGIVNDVSALRYDPRSAELVAKTGCPVVLMHAPGSGNDLHEGGTYESVVFDVFDALRERRDAAVAVGIAREKILLDPGLGFAKRPAHNWELLRGLGELAALGPRLLVGASRKSFLGSLLADEVGEPRPVDAREAAHLAVVVHCARAGVWAVRVHDVGSACDALAAWAALEDPTSGAGG